MFIGYTDEGDGANGYPVYEDDNGYWIDDPEGPGYVNTRPKLCGE